jgi:8-oxo-dGTP pyrophosphatase MutT (NUDIX family)/nucleoside 2-deoxyribosyltransferase
MKRLGKNNMIEIHSREDIPQSLTKSIFLAGPTPREKKELGWREEALTILRELGYDGVVFVPENRDNEPFNPDDKDEQIEWEHKCLKMADAIVFWIPREFRPDNEMLALTTNIEFGLFFNTDKLVIGGPDSAVKNDYIKKISDGKYEWHNNLKALLNDALDFIGDGIYRENTEVLVPQHIFKSNQFQNWYQPQKEIGNKLENFEFLYEFYMPKAKKLFLAVYKPDVYVKESYDGVKEDRVKDNEFVISRTDMSYIFAYSKNEEDIMKSELIVCEEFRTPVVNEAEMVFELPGGSSLNEDDDRLQTASKELEEETGLVLDSDRFNYETIKQSAATLCSHRIALFSVELTQEEIDSVKKDNEVHGVVEDTERIHLHVMTVEEAIKFMDWTNIGMIMSVLKGNK